jgi:hypothetical protein
MLLQHNAFWAYLGLPHIFYAHSSRWPIMRVEKAGVKRNHLALAVAVMILSISGVGVVWQYEGNSSSSSQNMHIEPSSSTDASASNAVNSGLWGWGGTPRGFSVGNGTLNYPDDYYTSHFNLGYNNSGPSYGQTKLANLSKYSTGFTTGYNAGYNIYSLLADGQSSYDPWNNYPGYDPNYPYGYVSDS